MQFSETRTNAHKHTQKRKGSGSTHTKKTAHGFVLSRLKSRLHKSLLYKKRILRNYLTYELSVELFITTLIYLNILLLKFQELHFNDLKNIYSFWNVWIFLKYICSNPI